MNTRSETPARGLTPLLIGLALLTVVRPASGQPAEARLKYGPQAMRLHQSHEYVRRHPAPDFWGLIPYYTSQPDDHSCALASATMMVNALRVSRPLAASEPLATSEAIVSQHAPWRQRLSADNEGVSLDQLPELIPPVLETYGLAPCRVEVHRFQDSSAAELARLRRILSANERSAQDIVIVNVLQSILTGDPEGAVGHMAPIGAFDADNDRVLLLDPDRRWYEPYWVPTDTLLEAMNTRDEVSGRTRGLLRVSCDVTTK